MKRNILNYLMLITLILLLTGCNKNNIQTLSEETSIESTTTSTATTTETTTTEITTKEKTTTTKKTTSTTQKSASVTTIISTTTQTTTKSTTTKRRFEIFKYTPGPKGYKIYGYKLCDGDFNCKCYYEGEEPYNC